MTKPKLTQEAIEAQIESAKKRTELLNSTEPRAIEAYYDKKEGRIKINFNNGSSFAFHPGYAEGLAGALETDLEKVEISPSGKGLHWETLDVDLSILGLMQGVFGSKFWMSEIGRQGGLKISPKKAAASKENGKKGGRPRRNMSDTKGSGV